MQKHAVHEKVRNPICEICQVSAQVSFIIRFIILKLKLSEPEQVLHLLPDGSICSDGDHEGAYPEGQRTHGRFTTFAASTRKARNAARA